MGSCNNDRLVTDSAEDGILKPSNNVTVNIEVAGLDGPSTKAIKQDWAPGDLVKIWFNYTTASQLPQLILTRNDANDGWNASELSLETVSGLQQSGGKFCVLYEASNSLFNTNYNPSEFSKNNIEEPGKTKLAQVWLYHTPMVCIANDVEYTFDGKTLSAVIAGWEFATQLQVVVTGIDKEDAEDYAMAVFGASGSKEGNVIGAMVHTSENKLETTSSSFSWVGGVPNADGVAFSFAYLSTTRYGTPEKISLYNTTTGVEKVLFVGSADLTTMYNHCKGIKVSVDKFSVPGALPGKFSVSATKKVQFSKGNLVATIDASGTPTAWKFATNQYDCLGEGGANKTIGSLGGAVDLFGWSTDAAYNNWGIHTKESATTNVTTGTFKDWGKNIGDGNTWRTLSTAEWQYLFDTRTASTVNGTANARYAKATVVSKTGIILLPDTYTHPEGVTLLTNINTANATFSGNTYDSANWAKMESAGAVFLPAAGNRAGSNLNSVNESGSYWSSSKNDDSSARFLSFNSSEASANKNGQRFGGYSVRLVTDVK